MTERKELTGKDFISTPPSSPRRMLSNPWR